MAFRKVGAAIAILGAAALFGASACAEDLPPAPTPGGGGGNPAGGGSGGGGGGAGGGAGGAGGTHSTDGCDDPADDCNGGICRFPTVDCELAADNWETQCATVDHCGLADPVDGSCRPRADILALCSAAFRERPSENATWHCFEQHAACDANYLNCVIVESCGG